MRRLLETRGEERIGNREGEKKRPWGKNSVQGITSAKPFIAEKKRVSKRHRIIATEKEKLQKRRNRPSPQKREKQLKRKGGKKGECLDENLLPPTHKSAEQQSRSV